MNSEKKEINAEAPTINPYGKNTQKAMEEELSGIKPTRSQVRSFFSGRKQKSNVSKNTIGSDGLTSKQREVKKRRAKSKLNHASKMAQKRKK